MPTELTVLALAGLLQVAQIIIFALFADRELGIKITGGARDETLPKLSKLTGRLQRAVNNHFEGLILFTLAVVVVTLGHQSTQITQICAWAYLAARVAYIPAYASGIFLLRSIIWGMGFIATVIMLIAALT